MKNARILMFAAFLTVTSLAVMTGCKYDVAEPLWDQPAASTALPVISSMEPSQAVPGTNIITIRGTNFTGALDTSVVRNADADTNTTVVYNGVFFGTVGAEIIQFSSTSITVRRPNLTAEACTVKVVPARTLLTARFGPYQVSHVLDRYGSFLDNLALSVVAADSVENLYVIPAASKAVTRVTPGGDKTVVATATLTPTDGRIGPDGRLYLMATSRQISAVDLRAGTTGLWRNCPSGKVVKFGDFDTYGYFYTGGVKTDLVIISPSGTFTSAGIYATAEILAVRAFNGYLYVAAKNAAGTTPSVGIWRHSIGTGGALGAKELVLDWDGTGVFATRTITAFAFATNGIMYIATDSENPILVYDPSTKSIDYFYKSIVPSYCKGFCWGTQNYVYLISGNTASPAQEWTVYRLDMGTTGKR